MQQLQTTDEGSQWTANESGHVDSSATTSRDELSPNKLSPNEIEALLLQLSIEAQKRKRKRRLKLIIIGVYLSFMALMLAIRIFWHSRDGLSFPFINFFWMIGGLGAASQLQKEGVRKLAKNLDIRGVGHFVDALGFRDKEVAKAATDALLVLLPRLQASDSHLLNDDQRAILHKQIRGDNTDLILAILKALEQIGDAKAVPFVEERANEANRRGNRGNIRQIREAAQACLPALNARVELERASHTLLRAAKSDRTDTGMLLRPASGAQMVDEQQLLRPLMVDSPPA